MPDQNDNLHRRIDDMEATQRAYERQQGVEHSSIDHRLTELAIMFTANERHHEKGNALLEKISSNLESTNRTIVELTTNQMHLSSDCADVEEVLHGKDGLTIRMVKLETSTGPMRRAWESLVVPAVVMVGAAVIAKAKGWL